MQFATTLKKNNKEKEKFDLISNAVASHPRKNGFISHVRHSLINCRSREIILTVGTRFRTRYRGGD